MKKLFCLLLTICFALSLAACSGGDTAPAETAPAETAPAETAAPAVVTEAAATGSDVDVDLTAMSSTMVYSEVLNMQQSPEQYMGKTVRMQGPFNVTEVGENRYFACVIADATACCATGIEFEWAGDHSYPGDYPEPNTEITVVGTFTTYMEGESRYLQLKDADVQF